MREVANTAKIDLIGEEESSSSKGGRHVSSNIVSNRLIYGSFSQFRFLILEETAYNI